MSNQTEEKQEHNEENTIQPQKKNYKLYAAALVVFIFIASASGYWYWTRTPQYSLKQVAKAVQNHDLPSFQKYVDLDTAASRMIDDLVKSQPSSGSNVADSLTSGLVEMMKPKLVDMVKSQVLDLVEKGDIENENTDDNISLSQFYPNENNNKSSKFKGTEYVKKEGNIALVGIMLYYPTVDQDIIAEVKMRKMGSYWQVAEFSNFAELNQEIEELKKAKLNELNKPIREEISKALNVKPVAIERVSEDAWGMSNKIYLNVPIKFLSDKSISQISGVITVSNLDNKVLLNMPINAQGSTYKDKESTISWEKDINPFIPEDKELFKTSDTALNIDVKITALKFADGTELKELEKLP